MNFLWRTQLADAAANKLNELSVQIKSNRAKAGVVLLSSQLDGPRAPSAWPSTASSPCSSPLLNWPRSTSLLFPPKTTQATQTSANSVYEIDPQPLLANVAAQTLFLSLRHLEKKKRFEKFNPNPAQAAGRTPEPSPEATLAEDSSFIDLQGCSSVAATRLLGS